MNFEELRLFANERGYSVSPIGTQPGIMVSAPGGACSRAANPGSASHWIRQHHLKILQKRIKNGEHIKVLSIEEEFFKRKVL